MRTPEQQRRSSDLAAARYWNDPVRFRALARVRSESRRAKHVPLINAIKLARGCIDCGYREHSEALQFDHRDPKTKSFQIAKSISNAWPNILAEIAKCDVRCANCHVVRSVREGHLGRPRIDVVVRIA